MNLGDVNSSSFWFDVWEGDEAGMTERRKTRTVRELSPARAGVGEGEVEEKGGEFLNSNSMPLKREGEGGKQTGYITAAAPAFPYLLAQTAWPTDHWRPISFFLFFRSE